MLAEGIREWGAEKIYGPKRDDVTGEWRRLHDKELYILYASSNITLVIKLRKMGQAGNVTLMEVI
jgi:hypothetical protein